MLHNFRWVVDSWCPRQNVSIITFQCRSFRVLSWSSEVLSWSSEDLSWSSEDLSWSSKDLRVKM